MDDNPTDLVHVHYAIPHAASAFLAREMLKPRRLPTMTTLHGTDITLAGKDRSYLPITRFSIERSDGITAVSHYLRGATYKTFGILNDIEVIHNFVNCDIYKPSGEAGPPAAAGTRRREGPDPPEQLPGR